MLLIFMVKLNASLIHFRIEEEVTDQFSVPSKIDILLFIESKTLDKFSCNSKTISGISVTNVDNNNFIIKWTPTKGITSGEASEI